MQMIFDNSMTSAVGNQNIVNKSPQTVLADPGTG
jgi:hypothetical protein